MQTPPAIALPTEVRILLVDDHEDTLAVLKRLLRLEGHFVKATTASHYAMELARTEIFDLVMSDIGLPQMDGCALLAELRAIRPIKAIALTGHGMPDEVEQVRKAGFNDVLVKPINFETLIQSVAKVITADGDGRGSVNGVTTTYAPNPKILMMKLHNYEKTLAMLGSEVERRKVECRISQIRRRLIAVGCKEVT